jgi:hypothetical protein
VTQSHAGLHRGEFLTCIEPIARRAALVRCSAVAAPLLVAAILGAKGPPSGPVDSLTTGLRYDLQLTTTSATSENGQPATSNSGLAHVEIVNGRVRIDVAEGEFAAIAGTGDILLFTDTSHAATLIKPDLKQYVQVDFKKLSAGLTNTVNAFGGAMGVQASNVKLDFASLGPGDKVGPFSTNKYRITQDYILSVSFLGAIQSKGTTMHSTTDYWYAPQLTMIVNPFANVVQETAWFGATYGQQLAALQAKLPKGVPVKTIMTDVATDSVGAKTTTTVTWELTNFVRADIPDDAFQIPADYTQMQAPTALLQPFGMPGFTNGSTPASSAGNGNNPMSGYVNGKALQAAGANGGATGALNTLLKASQSGAPAGNANGSTPGAPTTTWNGNGSAPSGGSPSAWSAATSVGASPTAGQNTNSAAPGATSGQDTTNARKGQPQ